MPAALRVRVTVRVLGPPWVSATNVWLFANGLKAREQALAHEHDRTVAWTLAHPAVSVVIVGARSPDHLHESIAAADVKLEDDDLWEIDKIMTAAVPVHGPAPELV